MRVTVNVMLDMSVGVLTHNTIPPPIPAPNLSVEMICTQLWAAGYVLKLNKLTLLVQHRHMGIVQEGHDCGILIPDITPAVMENAYYAVMWPMSSRKITFSASTVKMEKLATGCAQTIGLPPLPMMTCGDPVSAPTALVSPLQLLNSVTVGMTWGDLFIGLLTILVSMAIDLLFEYAFRGKAVSKKLAETIVKELLNKVFAKDLRNVGKRIVSAVSGFLISLLSGNPTIKPGLGGPFGGVEPSFKPFSAPSGGSPAPGQGARPVASGGAAPRQQFGGGGAGQSFGEALP